MRKKNMPLEVAIERVQNLRTMFKMLDRNDRRIPALDVAVAVMCEKLEEGKKEDGFNKKTGTFERAAAEQTIVRDGKDGAGKSYRL